MVSKPENVKIIDSKSVFRIKRNGEGNIQKYKARLGPRGFMQAKGMDYDETYAPVARLTTICTLLSVINHKRLIAQQMDAKTAFLHGFIKDDIYMPKPEGFEGNGDHICKLRKAMYGLKQAPFYWYNTFDTFKNHKTFRILKMILASIEKLVVIVVYLLLNVRRRYNHCKQ